MVSFFFELSKGRIGQFLQPSTMPRIYTCARTGPMINLKCHQGKTHLSLTSLIITSFQGRSSLKGPGAPLVGCASWNQWQLTSSLRRLTQVLVTEAPWYNWALVPKKFLQRPEVLEQRPKCLHLGLQSRELKAHAHKDPCARRWQYPTPYWWMTCHHVDATPLLTLQQLTDMLVVCVSWLLWIMPLWTGAQVFVWTCIFKKETWKHYVKWKKSVQRSRVPWDPAHELSRMGDSVRREVLGCQGLGGERNGEGLLLSAGFLPAMNSKHRNNHGTMHFRRGMLQYENHISIDLSLEERGAPAQAGGLVTQPGPDYSTTFQFQLNLWLQPIKEIRSSYIKTTSP